MSTGRRRERLNRLSPDRGTTSESGPRLLQIPFQRGQGLRAGGPEIAGRYLPGETEPLRSLTGQQGIPILLCHTAWPPSKPPRAAQDVVVDSATSRLVARTERQ